MPSGEAPGRTAECRGRRRLVVSLGMDRPDSKASTLLSRLRQQSDAVRAAETPQRSTEDILQDIDQRLWRLYRFLDEALAHLAVIKPKVAHEFRVDQLVSLSGLQFDKSVYKDLMAAKNTVMQEYNMPMEQGLAELAAQIGADGLNGDTMSPVPREFYTASLRAGRPLALEPENDDAKITVDFPGAGVRSFLASLVADKLTPL